MRARSRFATHAPAAVILIRLVVGAIFLSEGIQEFLFAATLGPGRFARIGFSRPDLLAPFVGSFEMVCGALMLLGLATRLLPLRVSHAISSPCCLERADRPRHCRAELHASGSLCVGVDLHTART
jgi:hypothetical protein